MSSRLEDEGAERGAGGGVVRDRNIIEKEKGERGGGGFEGGLKEKRITPLRKSKMEKRGVVKKNYI